MNSPPPALTITIPDGYTPAQAWTAHAVPLIGSGHCPHCGTVLTVGDTDRGHGGACPWHGTWWTDGQQPWWWDSNTDAGQWTSPVWDPIVEPA